MLQKHIFLSCSLVAQRQIQHTCTITDMSNFSMSSMNKQMYALLQKASRITQDYYPEQMAVMLIVNIPWSFQAVWSIISGWLDERTRSKIKIVKGQPIKELIKYIDIDQIPQFLGGRSTACLYKDEGPWNDYEVVDGKYKGDVVGIRKITDGPNGPVFTVDDMQALPNELLDDP